MLIATATFRAKFWLLQQYSKQLLGFSAHRGALMSKIDLTFPVFSIRFVDFVAQFCFRCTFSNRLQRTSKCGKNFSDFSDALGYGISRSANFHSRFHESIESRYSFIFLKYQHHLLLIEKIHPFPEITFCVGKLECVAFKSSITHRFLTLVFDSLCKNSPPIRNATTKLRLKDI